MENVLAGLSSSIGKEYTPIFYSTKSPSALATSQNPKRGSTMMLNRKSMMLLNDDNSLSRSLTLKGDIPIKKISLETSETSLASLGEKNGGKGTNINPTIESPTGRYI